MIRLWHAIVMAGALMSVVAWSAPASAQACCAASQTAGPVRLSPGQLAAVGVSADGRLYTGRFDGTNYRSQEHSNYEWRQTLFGARRIGDSWEVGATLPFVQSRRTTAHQSEWGGGLGDVSVQSRYELVSTGMSMTWPGIGIVASVVAPTGRSPTDSMARGKTLFQSDVTGGGWWRAGLGAQLEWTPGSWFVAAEAGTSQPLWEGQEERSREVSPLPSLTGRLSAGRPVQASLFWDGVLYLAASVTVDQDFGDRIDGTWRSDTAERRTSLQMQAGGYISQHWYLMARGEVVPPIDGLGQNRQAGPAVGLTVRRVFYAN